MNSLLLFSAPAFLLLFSITRPSAHAADLAEAARRSLSQINGKIALPGLHRPVEVLRDKWGVAHIYAKDAHDLFFAQGYVTAQDHLWQIELWRRNGEGSLSEVLGPEYVRRDKFARMLAYHGDWNVEFSKYHPQGKLIFDSFAEGINASIKQVLANGKLPVEFTLMGFKPEPVWSAKTIVTRMPSWNLSRNASSEITRALAIKQFGIEKADHLLRTTPHKAIKIPAGLDLNDIVPQILDVTKNASDLSWKFKPLLSDLLSSASGNLQKNLSPAPTEDSPLFAADSNFDLGSNNWVISGKKSATGKPLLANDPHREVGNPALRYLVHLVAPGWNDIGACEPGVPGISIGHNEHVGWGFTILGVDQQDIYVEEVDPQRPDYYMYKGQWLAMKTDRQTITIKGHAKPEIFPVKSTIHGPVLYEDTHRHRAYSLRWIGSEPGGAGYLGSLNVMQARNWKEFKAGVARSWYLPSHSLVYADTKGNYGYVAAALAPKRKNWDGLLPVPGKDGQYEWDGFVPLTDLPGETNGHNGFYASANNDVVPHLFPQYKTPLGYEYSASYRFDRITEVLNQDKKFTSSDLVHLQTDHMSLPARQLVPLLKGIKSDKPAVQKAIGQLLAWNYVLDRDSVVPSIYEYWVLKLMPLTYRPHLPPDSAKTFARYDIGNVIEWLSKPDSAFGDNPMVTRNRILVSALEQALAMLTAKYGDDSSRWLWGDIHQATFEHPLLTAETRSIFGITPVRRGGDAYTVQATSSPTEKAANQTHGASIMFVLDAGDWDRSVALNTPGNAAQPTSPHYADLASSWGSGEEFPLAFTRKKVESVSSDRLQLEPRKPHLP